MFLYFDFNLYPSVLFCDFDSIFSTEITNNLLSLRGGGGGLVSSFIPPQGVDHMTRRNRERQRGKIGGKKERERDVGPRRSELFNENHM